MVMVDDKNWEEKGKFGFEIKCFWFVGNKKITPFCLNKTNLTTCLYLDPFLYSIRFEVFDFVLMVISYCWRVNLMVR